MKNILILLAFCTLLSCSDDDNSKTTNNEIPANQKFLRKITYPDPALYYTFDYNDDKTIRKITSSISDDPFAAVLSFTYENGLMIAIDRIRASNTVRTTFSYDANKKLTGVTSGSAYRPMTYQAADNSYLTTSPDGKAMKFYVTADGDVGRTVTQNANDETYIGVVFNPQKNGPLFNTNAIALYVYLMEPSAIVNYGSLFSRRPVENITYFGNNPYTNTYDSQGFITESTESGATEGRIFEYMQL